MYHYPEMYLNRIGEIVGDAVMAAQVLNRTCLAANIHLVEIAEVHPTFDLNNPSNSNCKRWNTCCPLIGYDLDIPKHLHLQNFEDIDESDILALRAHQVSVHLTLWSVRHYESIEQ